MSRRLVRNDHAIGFADRAGQQVEPCGKVEVGVPRAGVARPVRRSAFGDSAPGVISLLGFHVFPIASPVQARANMHY